MVLGALERVAVGAVLAHPDPVAEAGAADHVAHGGARRGGHGGAAGAGLSGLGRNGAWVPELDYGFKVAVGYPPNFFSSPRTGAIRPARRGAPARRGPRSRCRIPTTRSLTVPETSTSFGAAALITREAMCTASPPTSPSITSSSPVWRPGADLEPERAHRLRDRGGAADRARGPVEGGEEAVAGALHLAAAVAVERLAEERVVALEQEAPAAVAHLGGAAGGVADVREQHGGEHPVRLALVARAGEELLDLADQRLRCRRARTCCPRPRAPRSARPGIFEAM